MGPQTDPLPSAEEAPTRAADSKAPEGGRLLCRCQATRPGPRGASESDRASDSDYVSNRKGAAPVGPCIFYLCLAAIRLTLGQPSLAQAIEKMLSVLRLVPP